MNAADMSRRVLLALSVLILQAPAHGAPACAPGFAKFLAQFERGKISQAQHTKYPLRYSHVDRDDPEMKQKTIQLDRNDATEYESFPSPQYQAKLKLERTIAKDASGRCAVRFNVPDSDSYALTFTFAAWKKSWRLVEIENGSL